MWAATFKAIGKLEEPLAVSAGNMGEFQEGRFKLLIYIQNKEKCYSQVPRLSDTRYSAKGTKGKWRYASSKARLKCATYPRSQYIVMWALDRSKRYGR